MPYKGVWLFLLCLTSAYSQIVIEGTVRDAVTLAPIANAKTTLYPPLEQMQEIRLVDGKPVAPPPLVSVSATGGEFQLTIPRNAGYSLGVLADGYRPDSRSLSNEPLQKFDLLLTRSSALTGRIVDKQTGAPVEGIVVGVMGIADSAINRDSYATPSRTDQQGRFRMETLPPGDFFLRLSDEMRGPTRLYLKGDTRATFSTRSYATQWWPGGLTLDVSHPFHVDGGATLDAGDFSLEQVALHNVTGLLFNGPCSGYPSVRIDRRNGPLLDYLGSVLVRCGGEYVISNLAPGTYFVGTNGWTTYDGYTPIAVRKIEIRDADIEVDLYMRHPSQIPKEDRPSELVRPYNGALILR